MNKDTYDRICQAVSEGKEKRVKNSMTQETGKVIECTGGSFDVEAGSRRAYWPKEDCETK